MSFLGLFFVAPKNVIAIKDKLFVYISFLGEVICLIFITLSKWKKVPSKENMERLNQDTKTFEELKKKEVKMQVYWTLGRYDGVTIIEAPFEKDAMKAIFLFQDVVETETLIAVPREEALKLI